MISTSAQICLIDISRVGRQSLWVPDVCYERREPRELECRGGNLSKLLWMQDVQNRQTVGQCARTAGYAYNASPHESTSCARAKNAGIVCDLALRSHTPSSSLPDVGALRMLVALGTHAPLDGPTAYQSSRTHWADAAHQ